MSPQSRRIAKKVSTPANQPEGPPGGTPYTVYFPDGEVLQAADLAYPAPLPSVGDMVEYIDASLATHRYVVREVVHTFQAEPRPRGSARAAEQSAEDGGSAPLEMDLRAGLPEVFLERVGPTRAGRTKGKGAKRG